MGSPLQRYRTMSIRFALLCALMALVALALPALARRKVPVVLPGGERGTDVENVDIDDGFLQVTLSPAPQLNLPPVPGISLATILQPTDTSSPFGGSDLPTINLPPIPPLNAPTALPPLNYFFDDDSVDDDNE